MNRPRSPRRRVSAPGPIRSKQILRGVRVGIPEAQAALNVRDIIAATLDHRRRPRPSSGEPGFVHPLPNPSGNGALRAAVAAAAGGQGGGWRDTVLPSPSPADIVNGAVNGPHPDELPRIRDRQNPAAVAYARRGLARLQSLGYDPAQLGITGDPTAQYRALSPILGLLVAAAQGQADAYQAPANVNPRVAEIIARLRQAAGGSGTGPSVPRFGGGPY